MAGYDTHADVFAYGMTMFEILTCGGWPYGKVDWSCIEKLVTKGKPPTAGGPKMPEDALPAFVNLHEACIAFDPSKRPPAAHVVSQLKEILGGLSATPAKEVAKAAKAAPAKGGKKKKK